MGFTTKNQFLLHLATQQLSEGSDFEWGSEQEEGIALFYDTDVPDWDEITDEQLDHYEGVKSKVEEDMFLLLTELYRKEG